MMATEKFVVRVSATLTIALMVLTCFFTQRSLDVDALALYNPIYTYLQHGQMTFPVHNQFYYMVVHPPLHYLIIANLMKLGISFYYAEQIPTLAMTLLILVLIERSKFPVAVKLGFIIAIPATLTLFLTTVWLINLRPDLHLALAWFAGLLALESARLEQWDKKRLFLGSFLLTFASGLHYYGAPACLGSLVYMVWAWKSLGMAKAWPKIGVMIAGVGLIGVPYLLLFLMPNWAAIRVMLTEVQTQPGLAGMIAAIQLHYSTYQFWQQRLAQPPYFLIFLLVLPALWVKFPLLAISTLVLGAIPAVRGIALAALPLPLFILCYSQAKSWGYYVPEVMLYFASVSMAGILLLQHLGRRLQAVKWRNFLMVVAVTVGSIIIINPWIGVVSKINPITFQIPFVHEMDIVRSATRELVGANALVSSKIALWYVSGGKFWYDYEREVVHGNGTELKNPTAYFSVFDAIALHSHMSNVSFRPDRKTLLSFYLDQTLRLKSFYLSGINHTVSQLFFSSTGSKRLEGYAYRRNHQLFHFQAQPQGNYLFVSTVCPVGSINQLKEKQVEFLSQMPILDERSLQPQQPTQELNSFLILQKEYEQVERSLPCQQQDKIAGTLQQVDVKLLLQKSKPEDAPIQFFQSFGEARAATLKQVEPKPSYAAPPWRSWQHSPDVRTQLLDGDSILKIKTDRSKGNVQIASPMIQLKKRTTYLGNFSVQVQEGGLGIQILDSNNQSLYSQLWCKTRNNLPIDTKFVFDTLDSTAISVMISNCIDGEPGRSKFKLKDLSFREVKMPNN